MSEKRKPRGRPFAPGFDARRHLLTAENRRKGYRMAPSQIKARIRGLYRGGRIVRTGEAVYEELAL
jgi:hypothetical protein